jgi:putative ABC transport system substrate-binding protein
MRTYHIAGIALVLSAAVGCGGDSRESPPPQSAGASAPSIQVVYAGPHPLVTELIDGFKEVVLRSYPQARVRERHAQNRPEEYGTAVLAALNDRPDLLVPITTPLTILAVERARGQVPVVFMAVTDPVGAHVARSLEQPGFATGSSDLCPFAGMLQVTRELLPQARTLGLPYNPGDQPAVFGRAQLQALAPQFGFTVTDRQVTSRDEMANEIRGLAGQVDAVLLPVDNLLMENPDLVSAAAAAQGRPVVACDAASVEKGAVAGVSVTFRDVGRAAGERAVRVLRGEAAGSIPVAVLREGGVTLNARAACRARVQLPTPLRARATAVVDSTYRCTRPSTSSDR